MMTEAECLTTQAEKAKETAEPEFEALNGMKKAQAGLSFATNLKSCGQIPAYFKKAAESMKTDLEEI